MRKLFFFMISLLITFTASRLQAQVVDYENYDWNCTHCQKIAADRYHVDNANVIPNSKIAYFCALSRNFFYVTDEVPEGAIVYNISDVVNERTQMHFPENYVVDLDSMNVFSGNFIQLQLYHNRQHCYFRTPGSEHQYLGMRTYSEAEKLTDHYLDLYDTYDNLPKSNEK